MPNLDAVTHPVATSDTIGNVAIVAIAIDAVAALRLTLIGAMNIARTAHTDMNAVAVLPATNATEIEIETETDVIDSKLPMRF
jgi:hypothetical protein